MNHLVYGISLATTWPLLWAIPRSDREPDVTFEVRSEPPTISTRQVGPTVALDGWQMDEGPPITFEPHEAVVIVRFEGVADHYVGTDRIICHLRRADLGHLVHIQLLGTVLAVWFERRGQPTLHASVVTVGEQAVGFLGGSGSGKTTAATALIAAGHAHLVDDLAVPRWTGGAPTVSAGYPTLRLWPDQIEHFIGPATKYPRVHPTYDKRLVRVGEGFGEFHSGDVPLTRLYVTRRDKDVSEPKIEAMGLGRALLVLISHSFLPQVVNGLGFAAGRLRYLADVVEAVQVRRLHYPAGFQRLPELVDAVERDLENRISTPGDRVIGAN